ncbi:hypothetical protein CBS101457_006369 [Exobasidium rhododendri]|nr:hypothetical protein CBS101457_006369 [Exobasidium rhododendri]
MQHHGAPSQKYAIKGDCRSQISAHHYSKLQPLIPLDIEAVNRTPTDCSSKGHQQHAKEKNSTLRVPASQAVVAHKILTLQERRRLSRRSQFKSTSHRSSELQKRGPSSGIRPSNVPAPTHQQYKPLRPELVKKAYSSSGFDLIGALLRVSQRPNPKIDIGAVDLSCAFVISDAQHPDQPIVHCSDSFCQLTGYSREEILGRNCRFLQSPNGQVEKGSERLHTDNGAAKHLGKHCNTIQECQASLINYRRDGTPFINLVTIVPIHWGNSSEPVYMVGFQVDLVDHPDAVLEQASNGLYTVNYRQVETSSAPVNVDASLVVEELDEEAVSKRAMDAHELAELISSGSTETTKWARILLDNANDLIHVLSLKGNFLYVSPSVERLLGYKAEEMIGRSISEFCHPSDVVPVFRELKDSTSNASIAAAAKHWARVDGTINPPTKGGAGQTGPQVNMIMRMTHKLHGYVWMENVGKLHLEQGKGRKVVISTGRPRPVYNLPWEQARRTLERSGSNFWSKVSQDGLILSTSGVVADVLKPQQSSPLAKKSKFSLAGMHLCDVVNKEALIAFHRALQLLKVSAIPHLMHDGSGGPCITVMSTLIPSSTDGIGLPTVFVHTQQIAATSVGPSELNKIRHAPPTTSSKEAGQAAGLSKEEAMRQSVFGELSTVQAQPSSWVYELHQLKNTNKRLREEIRNQQRRISGNQPTLLVTSYENATKDATKHHHKSPRSDLEKDKLNGSSSDSSLESRPLLSPFQKDAQYFAANDSSSDATSIVTTPDTARAGLKRSHP